jgi:hypothetical protein
MAAGIRWTYTSRRKISTPPDVGPNVEDPAGLSESHSSRDIEFVESIYEFN